MTWYVYGIMVAVILGTYNFLYGLLLRNMQPSTVLMGLGLGILVVGLSVKNIAHESFANLTQLGIPILVGLFLGLGMFFLTKAFADPNARVSQLIPLVNANTLISVVLGLVILKEYQSVSLIKVIIGTILIMLGAVVIK